MERCKGCCRSDKTPSTLTRISMKFAKDVIKGKWKPIEVNTAVSFSNVPTRKILM